MPAQVVRIDVQDASAGHGGGRGVFQVADLKEKPHGGRERDAFIIGQSKNLHISVKHQCDKNNIHI